MAKWKLCRQTYGNDIYEITEGEEVSIGRGTQNTIILPSLNISRKHCVITVKKDEVLIEDLKSANGIFVGLKKIPPNIPFSLSNNDIIGLGWADGAPLAKVNDAEKFVFKLLKTTNESSIIDRIKFQNEMEAMVKPTEINNYSINLPLPIISKANSRLSLKRKSTTETQNHYETSVNNSNIKHNISLSFNALESDNDLYGKKIKYDFDCEGVKEEPIIKIENVDEQYEAFNVKQECFDDEVQIIDSDSDSEQWYIRLSQNSPRKSFSTFNENRNSQNVHQDSSYSQLDDDVIFVENENKIMKEPTEEEYEDDLFTTLPPPINVIDNKSVEINDEKNKESENKLTSKSINNSTEKCNLTSNLSPILNLPMDVHDGVSNIETVVTADEIIKRSVHDLNPVLKNISDDHIEKSKHVLPIKPLSTNALQSTSNNKIIDAVVKTYNLPNTCSDITEKVTNTKHITVPNSNVNKSPKFYFESTAHSHNDNSKKIQLIDHKSQPSKKSSHNSKGKIKKKNASEKPKIQITNSQKEQRKKKLREIAVKAKPEYGQSNNSNSLRNEQCGTILPKVSVKVTPSNRGAFLIDSKQITSKSTSKRKVVKDNKDNKNDANTSIHINDGKDPDSINATKSLVNNETKDQTAMSISIADGGEKHLNKSKSKHNVSKSVHSKDRRSTDTIHSSVAGEKPNNIIMNRRHSDNVAKECNKTKQPVSIIEEGNEKLMSKCEIENRHSTIDPKRKEKTSLEKTKTNPSKIPTDDKTSNSNQKTTTGDIKLQYKIQIPSENIKPALKSYTKTILKPLKENKEPNRKSEKRVRFSEVQPQVVEFEIEQGNQMKKTSSVKSLLLATQHSMPVFSLHKIALMRILRWNPQWLEEQNNFNEPPPILGHNNVSMAIPHSFTSHTHYVEVIGDLLLMEIWECLTQGYIRTRNDKTCLDMRIESLPLVPPQRFALELINLNVNVSVPTVQIHRIPREGEIMMLKFGDNGHICRFFFVQNVRCLPSPPNNINSFYSISLQTSFTEKIRTLQRGAVMYGKSLAYINKDLRLFEAMEYLSRSPLNEIILNPQSRHFVLDEADLAWNMESQWTKPLNDSQRKAVTCAVSAAHGERPRIHMIQGPPGTGKSRVICAIVMEYYYDAAGKKQKNRGKILLCATSNAAVDELVIRLLDIRQSLPQPERLKVVRVGRVEAMHPRARDISSLKLAQRDVARLQPDAGLQHSGLSAEISLLEAKKNMWQTKAMSAEDDARKAYCHNRVTEISKKIAMFRSGAGGGGAGCGPEQLAQAERRVLEGADVVVTTLASAHSYKMRGLAGRIALCVVDEAGQAIEPETLVPLTLGVTRLALVGDPQQLPGFICSQRAKDLGLGNSLFSRLSSCSEVWGEGGPVLLDRQYRMHPHIADYPNRAFYDGRVGNHQAHSLALNTAPYFILGIISGDNGQDTSGANEAEAWGAARVALALRARLRAVVPPAESAAHSLAVITPYAAQRDLVRRHLRTLHQVEGGGSGEEGDVEVNTVDSFQGQERSVVVVSLARSHGLGFLAAAGRMNVLLTRAKHALVLCLNPRALEKNHQWRTLVEDAQKRNLYGTLPLQMCSHPSVENVSSQEILQYLSCKSPVTNTENTSQQMYNKRSRKKYRGRHNRGGRN